MGDGTKGETVEEAALDTETRTDIGMTVGPEVTGKSNTKANETTATLKSIMGVEKDSTKFTESTIIGWRMRSK